MWRTQEMWSESTESSTAIHSMEGDSDISLGHYQTELAVMASNSWGRYDQKETEIILNRNMSCHQWHRGMLSPYAAHTNMHTEILTDLLQDKLLQTVFLTFLHSRCYSHFSLNITQLQTCIQHLSFVSHWADSLHLSHLPAPRQHCHGICLTQQYKQHFCLPFHHPRSQNFHLSITEFALMLTWQKVVTRKIFKIS